MPSLSAGPSSAKMCDLTATAETRALAHDDAFPETTPSDVDAAFRRLKDQVFELREYQARLREPELYAWMEAQVCAGCVGATATGGYPAAEEAARTISGPSKLPEEDLGYGLRRDTPVPEGVEVYATEPAADSI